MSEMKKITQDYIVALNSKMNESRYNEKYCDVTIKVGEKLFKCHRLILGSASEYFDAMFRGNFKESNSSEDIQLKEIEATTFENVVQFIYTGDVLVTTTNVLDLIRTSEFYNLPSLKKLCHEFIREKIKADVFFEDALKIFAFTCGTTYDDKEDKLNDSLSAYIRKHLYYFLNTPTFLSIQFKDLRTILKQSAPSQNENEVVHAIIRWVQQSDHSKDAKGKLLNKLLEKVNYANVSPEFMKLVVQLYVEEHVVFKRSENDDKDKDKNDNASTAGSSTYSELSKMRVVGSSIPQSLYVYINSLEKVTNVYTLQKYTGGFDWLFLCKANDNSDVMRIASFDDHLYCLNYCNPQESLSSSQTFSVSSSVSLFDKLYLKAPPLVVNQFDMDRMNRCLYIYNKNTFSNIVRNSEDLEFTDDVISRGVYKYDCETDRWMSLPPLLQKLANACMTCDHVNGLVYLIGGSDPTQQRLHGYVQTYDPRCASWMAITPSHDFYENGACCFSETRKRIYVSGGLKHPKRLERYDAVAGKWSRCVKDMNVIGNPHCLISHGIDAWAFGKNLSESSVEVFHHDSSGWLWSSVPSLSIAVKKNELVQKIESSVSSVVDCVTFKPYGL